MDDNPGRFDSNLPEEVRQYYAAEQKERKGMAWILSAVTVAVVLVVSIAGFYGVRWTYRKVHNSNETTSTTTAKEAAPSTNKPKTTPITTKSPATGSAPAQTESTNSVLPQNSPAATNAPTASTNTPATNSNTPAANSKTPANSNNSALTKTGPGQILTVFVLSTLFSTIAARFYLLHRQNLPE